MKNVSSYLVRLFIAAIVIVSVTVNAHAQFGLETEQNAGPITFDNSGNMYYASEYIKDDGASGNVLHSVLISKRSATNADLGSVEYNYSTPDEAGDVARDIKVIGSNLYVLIAGKYDFSPFDDDAVLVKYNLSLVYQWERFYNHPGNTDETPVMLAAGPSGSILLLTGSAGNVVTLKYNSAGTLLNQVSYSASATSTEWPVKIVYFNSAIYVSGAVANATGDQTLLIKYNNSLVQQWASRFRASASAMNDKPQDLKVDAAGIPYLSGGYYVTAGTRPYVVKYDPATGARTWTRKMGTNNVWANFLFIDNTANPFFYSTANLYVRLNKTNGATLLSASIPNGADFYSIRDARKGSDNNIYVMGEWDSSYTDPGTGFFYQDDGMYIMKVNSNARRLWRIFRGVNDPHFTSWPGNIAVRGNTTVYYNYNNNWVGFTPPYDNYVVTGMISTSGTPRLMDENAEEESPLLVYPNPAGDYINLELFSMESDQGSVEIYDLSGKLIESQPWEIFEETNSLKLDLSAYGSGIYLVKVKAGTGTYTEKVVVK